MKPHVLLMVLLIAALGCGGGTPTPAPSPPVEHTDLAALQRLLHLPAGVQEVRFTHQALGTPGGLVPGPTDYRVDAWLRMDPDAWAAIDAAWGAPRTSPRSLPLSTGTVQWLSGGHPWPSLVQDGSDWLEPQPLHYATPELGVGAVRCSQATRVGDHGLHLVGITM